MRIISGRFKGRTFHPPADRWPTRPTTDIAKEGLYNILANRLNFEEIRFCDLFGGTGSHTYEVISRGCEKVDYVDKFRPACTFVKNTIELLKIENQVQVYCMDIYQYINQCPLQYDYVFAGPPYGMPKIEQLAEVILEKPLITNDGLLVIEHHHNISYQRVPQFQELRNYGQTCFSFFQNN